MLLSLEATDAHFLTKSTFGMFFEPIGLPRPLALISVSSLAVCSEQLSDLISS
jgi:hypothetical protein